MLIRHTPGQQFDDIPSFDDHVGVPGLPGGSHRHAPFYQVQLTVYTL